MTIRFLLEDYEATALRRLELIPRGERLTDADADFDRYRFTMSVEDALEAWEAASESSDVWASSGATVIASAIPWKRLEVAGSLRRRMEIVKRRRA